MLQIEGGFWTYPNAIETAVLLAVVYDVVFHQINALREIRREKEAEARTIDREHASERRQIARETQELIRRHWQELQYDLIVLSRVATRVQKNTKFVKENGNSQEPTIRRTLEIFANGFPQLLSEFDDSWGRVVGQLNVSPQPRDPLALEILATAVELGKTVEHKNIEIEDKTLADLSGFITKVSDKAVLPAGE